MVLFGKFKQVLAVFRFRFDYESAADFPEEPANFRIGGPHVVHVHAFGPTARARQVLAVTDLVEANLALDSLAIVVLWIELLRHRRTPGEDVVRRPALKLFCLLLLGQAV